MSDRSGRNKNVTYAFRVLVCNSRSGSLRGARACWDKPGTWAHKDQQPRKSAEGCVCVCVCLDMVHCCKSNFYKEITEETRVC